MYNKFTRKDDSISIDVAILNVRDFRNLKVYQKARDLINDIYHITEKYPSFETYIIKSQIIRAATSIAANIAEGSNIYLKKTINFYNNALASAYETRNWLILSLDRNYITKEEFDNLDAKTEEIIKMLIGCIKKVKKQLDSQYKKDLYDN